MKEGNGIDMMEKLSHLRATSVWNGLVIVFGATASLIAAFMLALEAYWKALNPNAVFGCDVNEKISCSTVAASWQSTLVPWPGKPNIPNAFFGIGAFTVILVIGVVLACGWRPPKWFTWCFRGGVLFALAFATWLLEQSMFSIGAVCPWCLTMDVGMVFATAGMVRFWMLENADDHPRAWRFAVHMESMLVFVLVLILLAAVVWVHYMVG